MHRCISNIPTIGCSAALIYDGDEFSAIMCDPCNLAASEIGLLQICIENTDLESQ